MGFRVQYKTRGFITCLDLTNSPEIRSPNVELHGFNAQNGLKTHSFPIFAWSRCRFFAHSDGKTDFRRYKHRFSYFGWYKNIDFSHILGSKNLESARDFPPAGDGADVAPGPAGGEVAEGAAGGEARHPEAVPRRRTGRTPAEWRWFTQTSWFSLDYP